MINKPKLINRYFITLFLVSIAVCTGMNMLNVIVPLFVVETLGSTTAVSGILATVYTVAACLCRPAFNIITDRTGRRKIMILGCIIFAVACVTWMALGAEAVRRSPPERRGAANSTFYFAFDAAIGTGATIWGIMIELAGFAACYFLSAAGYLMLIIAAVIVFRKNIQSV